MELLGCGLRDFVVVGRVVLYSLIVIQLFSFFSFLYSYFIFHSCLESLPYPPSLSNSTESSFLTPFLRHPIPSY